MHILVINDDGPPDPAHSPYIHSLVRVLRGAGNVVSVCLPHVQRSWIGKAHFIGERVTPSYYRPGNGRYGEGGVTSEFPTAASSAESSGESDLSNGETPVSGSVPGAIPAATNSAVGTAAGADEWVLVDGTPASCAQLGLHHLFTHRGPVDLVVSGPNFGRNTSALYALSSGTLGGAMEAAACHVKAIGLSFAYDRPRHDDPDVIVAASRHSVRVIHHIWDNWGEGVDVYSINVPLRPDVETQKTLITFMIQNRWAVGQSCFRAVDAPGRAEGNVVEEKDKAFEDKAAREGQREDLEKQEERGGYRHRYYEWAPSHASVRKSAQEAPEGSDGKVILQGYTSVTPLKAAFWEVPAHPMGEMRLSLPSPTKFPETPNVKLLAHIAYDDTYVQPLILSALTTHLSSQTCTLLPEPLPLESLNTLSCPYLHIASYESISHESLLDHPTTYVANAYTIRKALIRKHYLASTVATWRSKHPGDMLGTHLPLTLSFELDYAEFLDEALIEAYELHEAWARNADEPPAKREWWILKPGMSDRGQGIRLFSSEDELREIFEEWEAANPEDEEGDGSTNGENEAANSLQDVKSAAAYDHDRSEGLMASQLRHFVVQPYIPPFLLPQGVPHAGTKFHLRTYVLALGALKVFVHSEPLALFAAAPYIPPGAHAGSQEKTEGIAMRPHLTNTCLQTSSRQIHHPKSANDLDGTAPPQESTNEHDGPVSLFSSLPLPLPLKESILGTINTCTASLFRAASAMPTHFQPLPNAFEVFGIDWLIDHAGSPQLLEVNAFPDFGQSGDAGHCVVQDVWNGAVGIVLRDRGLLEEAEGKEMEGFVKVLDMDLGRRVRRDKVGEGERTSMGK